MPALVDTFGTWLAARTDPATIPFGEIEGVGLSDPSKLNETYGWTDHQIVHRYLDLGIACFAVLAAAWLYFTYTARRSLRARGLQENHPGQRGQETVRISRMVISSSRWTR